MRPSSPPPAAVGFRVADRAVARQRPAGERINSQTTALGCERPKIRNQRAVARLNTLTYLVINARARRPPPARPPLRPHQARRELPGR